MKALIFDLDGSRQPSMSGGLFKRAVMPRVGMQHFAAALGDAGQAPR